jgi:hypothetical protein
MRAIVIRLQPVDGDSRHALQGFRGGLVRKSPEVGRGDGIHDCRGVFFDVLGSGEGLLHACDDDLREGGLINSAAGSAVRRGLHTFVSLRQTSVF